MGGIIGPYIFKGNEGRNDSMNGECYRAMISKIFSKMEDLNLAETGAQLRNNFGEQFNSPLRPVNWPLK